MEEKDLFFRFGIALVAGILVGLQREFAFDEQPDKELAAGVRTFGLMGLTGCAAAMVADKFGSPLPFVAVVIVIGTFFSISYFIEASKYKSGLTSEVSVILTLLVGALVYWNQITLAVALSVTITVLLTIKTKTNWLVRHITWSDIYATLKFAVITAIVLPVLPNQDFGPPPFDVLNPFKIWLLVIFISGISFVGYLLIKIVGAKKGIGLTGLLGGLASSTAVTLSFTERSRENEGLSKSFAFAILIAWTVMYFRVLIGVAVVNRQLANCISIPLVIAVVVGLIYSLYLFRKQDTTDGKEDVSFSNPFKLGPAIKFGMIFTVILLISKAAQVYMGETGIYLSSFFAGLADADAIALSLAQLSKKSENIGMMVAARAIVFATVANTFAKGGIIMISGAPELRRSILPGFLLMMVTSMLVVFLI